MSTAAVSFWMVASSGAISDCIAGVVGAGSAETSAGATCCFAVDGFTFSRLSVLLAFALAGVAFLRDVLFLASGFSAVVFSGTAFSAAAFSDAVFSDAVFSAVAFSDAAFFFDVNECVFFFPAALFRPAAGDADAFVCSFDAEADFVLSLSLLVCVLV